MDSSRRALYKYTFSASAEINHGGTTHLPFAAPRSPSSARFVAPTILQRFGESGPISVSDLGFDIVDSISNVADDRRGHSLHSSSRATSVLSSRHASPFAEAPTRQQTPASQLASRQATPAPLPASRQSTPAPSRVASRAQTPASVTAAPSRAMPAASVRVSRSGSEVPGARSTPSGRTLSVPPDNFEDYLLPIEAGGSLSRTRSGAGPSKSLRQRSNSAASDVTVHGVAHTSGYHREVRLCQLTDEEKLALSNRKGKGRGERPYTAWFELTSDEPRSEPPDPAELPELTQGDLFVHRSQKGIQIWLWSDVPEEGLHWKPVLLGCKRAEDRRQLTLTLSEMPSWVTHAWYRKKKPKTPVFVWKK